MFEQFRANLVPVHTTYQRLYRLEGKSLINQINMTNSIPSSGLADLSINKTKHPVRPGREDVCHVFVLAGLSKFICEINKFRQHSNDDTRILPDWVTGF